MKMTIFWDVELCSLVAVYQHFSGACLPMMEAASTPELSVDFYQTTSYDFPEDILINRCVQSLNLLIQDELQ
jgi:hypothetical protein